MGALWNIQSSRPKRKKKRRQQSDEQIEAVKAIRLALKIMRDDGVDPDPEDDEADRYLLRSEVSCRRDHYCEGPIDWH